MNIYLHPRLTLFWIIVILAKIVLCVIIAKTRWRRRSYFFTLYIFASTMTESLLFLCSALRAPWAYTWTYWIGNTAMHGFAFGSACYCFRALFFPFTVLPYGFRKVFNGCLIALTLGIVAFGLLGPRFHDRLGGDANLFALDRSVTWWLCGLFWALSIASDWLRIPWRTKEYGVGLGFLFLYSVGVALTFMRSILHWQLGPALWPIGFAAELSAVFVWGFYCMRKEPELAPLSLGDIQKAKEMLSVIQREGAPLGRIS